MPQVVKLIQIIITHTRGNCNRKKLFSHIFLYNCLLRKNTHLKFSYFDIAYAAIACSEKSVHIYYLKRAHLNMKKEPPEGKLLKTEQPDCAAAVSRHKHGCASCLSEPYVYTQQTKTPWFNSFPYVISRLSEMLTINILLVLFGYFVTFY